MKKKGRGRLRVTRHHLPWNVPKRVRIVQLTDVHVGWATPQAILDCAIQVAHALRPSFVAMTGDYVNHTVKHVDRLSDLVARLPQPVFATLGNHDHWSGAEKISDALALGGARVLTNEHVDVDLGGFRFPVVGIDDGRTDHADVARAFDRLPGTSEPLVLTHYPNTADAIAERSKALIIAGHTHGGQMHVPGVTHLVSKMAGQRYLAGWYEVERAHLYVSAGIGQSHRGLRGGHHAMPEIAVYDLTPLHELDTRSSLLTWESCA